MNLITFIILCVYLALEALGGGLLRPGFYLQTMGQASRLLSEPRQKYKKNTRSLKVWVKRHAWKFPYSSAKRDGLISIPQVYFWYLFRASFYTSGLILIPSKNPLKSSAAV